MRKKLLLISSAACMLFGTLNAQQRTCGTTAPGPEFEQWMQEKMQQMQASGQRMANTVYNIPVIVHVINNGEAVGTGTNISQAQIQSQIDVLNEDYRKLNSDASSVPAAFSSLAADCQINFCLATVDPTGATLAQPGIHRVNRNTMGWTAPPYSQSYIDATIKPSTIWNVSNYLNMWVMNLGNGLLGYATFPAGSTLTGLSAPYGSTTDDGVVILYTAFGRTGNVSAPYNKGRTATHEVGHWLGLRHIWGDANCGNDYCADTPTQQTANYAGCPAYPKISCSNGPNGEMWMNYMDYVTDACMYMFSAGQAARMQTCMANGTYRASLASSPACSSTSLALDAGILTVNSPTGTLCTTSFTPSVTLKNYGASTLTSVTISYQVDANPVATYSWSGSLASNATAVITLPSVTTTAGSHTFTASTSNPNSGTDGNTANNSGSNTFSVISNGQNLPFVEGFEGTTFAPAGWVLNNPDGLTTWVRTTTAAKTGVASAKMDNFNYNAAGQKDELTTPALNLASLSNPALTFQVAYRLYTDPTTSPNYSDTLQVLISTDCGNTWSSLYMKSGATLATATPAFSTTAFTPTSTQWRMETVPLTTYASASNAMIKFRNISQYENNMYLDDINITGVTSITEVALDGASIYPNPTDGKININVALPEAQDINIHVFNTLGVEVWKSTEAHSMGGLFTLDLSGNTNGIYFIEIKTNTGKVTKKIILNQ